MSIWIYFIIKCLRIKFYDKFPLLFSFTSKSEKPNRKHCLPLSLAIYSAPDNPVPSPFIASSENKCPKTLNKRPKVSLL